MNGPPEETRPVPYAAEAEASVLGAAFVDPQSVWDARAILNPDDFFRDRHRVIFTAMCELVDSGEVVDPVTLTERLKSKQEMEEAGGYSYVAQIMDTVPSAANVENHARIVREKAALRRIIRACHETIEDVYSANGEGAAPVIEAAERRIFRAAEAPGRGGFIPAKQSLWKAMEEIEAEGEREGGVTGLATGFPTLDRMTAGLQPGDMTILAARPSMGKTAMALGMASNVAGGGGPVGIVSLEMSDGQLAKRMIASRARVDLMKIRRGELTKEEYEKLARASAWFNDVPIHIDDQLSASVPEIRAKLRRLVAGTPVSLLVVDYLQLMDGDGRNRVQEIGSLTRGLKRIAREFDLHALVLSQLSRAPERREPPRPILSDLRESGDIEQDADNVLLLWRPEYYHDDETPEEVVARQQGKGELIIGKQRNGPTGRIKLRWDQKTTTFTELAREHEEERAAATTGGGYPWEK